jgi:hypothetical protein
MLLGEKRLEEHLQQRNACDANVIFMLFQWLLQISYSYTTSHISKEQVGMFWECLDLFTGNEGRDLLMRV